MDGRVLVLNQNYEPLNVCTWQRAVALLFLDKAVAIEHDGKILRASNTAVRLPTVVRLNYLVKRPLPEVRISRSSIMARDANTCQYCGAKSKTLTLDHVLPKDRGGAHTWENVVACCTECNNKKGNRTPSEAGMKLRKRPGRPRFIPYLNYPTFRAAVKRPEWRDYLEPFAPHLFKE
ncbi:MAG: HNH endonuclease [Armatimonadetes bacterium]|nr:HNH endonuclease [Armatimonadota bacterium]